jgi:hypothetical protein
MPKPSPEKPDPLADARAIMGKLTAMPHTKHAPLKKKKKAAKK